jgi:hypothetical protein
MFVMHVPAGFGGTPKAPSPSYTGIYTEGNFWKVLWDAIRNWFGDRIKDLPGYSAIKPIIDWLGLQWQHLNDILGPYLQNPMELQVMDKLLVGENLVLELLRNQLSVSRIASREATGIGFYLNFEVDSEDFSLSKVPGVKTNFSFGDVEMSAKSLKNGAGFLLWVKDGKIDFLEGYTYDENWPEQIDSFELHYIGGDRDLAYLTEQWS